MADNLGAGRGRLPDAAQRQRMVAFFAALRPAGALGRPPVTSRRCRISPDGSEKLIFSPRKSPLDIQNTLSISNLDAAWLAGRQRNFGAAKRHRQRTGRGI